MAWSFIISAFLTTFAITLLICTVLVKKLNFRTRLLGIKKDFVIKKEEKVKKVNKKATVYSNFSRKLEVNIEAAAIPLTLKEFLFVLIICNLIILLLGTLFISFFMSIIFSILFTALVFIILPMFQMRRKNKMIQQLPDVLELISNALKTGYSIVQTLDLVSKENFPPLSDEFAKLIKALKYGETLEVAFNDLADRLDISEVRTVVDTILITRETGGNMTHVIEGLLEMMRENLRLQGEVKALTAQGRISSLVIGSLPIFLFALLLMINPDYMMLLFTHPLGIIMTVIAGVSQVIGYFIMHKLIQLKVR